MFLIEFPFWSFWYHHEFSVLLSGLHPHGQPFGEALETLLSPYNPQVFFLSSWITLIFACQLKRGEEES